MSLEDFAVVLVITPVCILVWAFCALIVYIIYDVIKHG